MLAKTAFLLALALAVVAYASKAQPKQPKLLMRKEAKANANRKMETDLTQLDVVEHEASVPQQKNMMRREVMESKIENNKFRNTRKKSSETTAMKSSNSGEA